MDICLAHSLQVAELNNRKGSGDAEFARIATGASLNAVRISCNEFGEVTAAITNAVCYATGKRVRELPIYMGTLL